MAKVDISFRAYLQRAPLAIEIDASLESESWGRKLGAAIKIALKSDADLSGAVLSGADLSGADLRGADLSDAVKIPHIDAAILAAVDTGGNLEMGNWHTCQTTHCLAGWAITLAGEAGLTLEREYGPAAAGALIYAASSPDKRIPNFYATNADAMADLRARAAEDPLPPVEG